MTNQINAQKDNSQRSHQNERAADLKYIEATNQTQLLETMALRRKEQAMK